MPNHEHGRRAFLAMMAGAAAASTSCKAGDDPPLRGPNAAPKPTLPAGGTVPTRPLGRTKVAVSILGIGGAHLARPSEQEAIRIVRMAIDHGMTFMDNSWDYSGGKSEERMGKALADGYRQRAFLMTKIDGRTKASAAAQLEQSLRRLRADVIDLVQVHEVIRITDPTRVFAPGGAIEALVDAQKAGKLRFIGFTGHKDPSIHLAMLRTAAEHGFRFDAVQMPINVMDPHYRSFQKEVLPELVQDQIGVLGMKSMGDNFIFDSGVVTAPECLRYALSVDTSVVITGCQSVDDVVQALDVGMRFSPMTDAEKREILTRTGKVADNGRYEKFKTTGYFDSTVKHPEWLE